MVIVVMGASGAGKSTVASLLAERLGWAWYDADAYHPAENIEKMGRGIPLSDADRQPWLRGMRQAIDAWVGSGANSVLACSALKRAYREQLNVQPKVIFAYLRVSSAELRARLQRRKGHFAGANLLESQLTTLEEPGADEPAIVVESGRDPEAIVSEIIQRLGLTPGEALG